MTKNAELLQAAHRLAAVVDPETSKIVKMLADELEREGKSLDQLVTIMNESPYVPIVTTVEQLNAQLNLSGRRTGY